MSCGPGTPNITTGQMIRRTLETDPSATVDDDKTIPSTNAGDSSPTDPAPMATELGGIAIQVTRRASCLVRNGPIRSTTIQCRASSAPTMIPRLEVTPGELADDLIRRMPPALVHCHVVVDSSCPNTGHQSRTTTGPLRGIHLTSCSVWFRVRQGSPAKPRATLRQIHALPCGRSTRKVAADDTQ